MARVAAVSVALIVRWDWARLPPLPQRTLPDDLKWAFAFVLGVTVAYLLSGADDCRRRLRGAGSPPR
jgi:hypothetical protein